MGQGDNGLLGCMTVTAALSDFPSATPPAGRHYYWDYFDGAGASDWLLMASPSSGTQLGFDLNLQGGAVNLSLQGNLSVAPSHTFFTSYRGIAGGPLVLTSLTNQKAMVSQRILWAGGALEEVVGTDQEKLSEPPLVDLVRPVEPGHERLGANRQPAGQPSRLGQQRHSPRHRFHRRQRRPGSEADIEPGRSWYAQFPGRIGGPVEVKSYRAGGDWNNAADRRPVIASQRVLSNQGRAFNEMPGIPDSELRDHYHWAWYDEKSPGSLHWVLVANPGSQPVTYQIRVGDQVMPSAADNPGTIPAGGMVTPRFPGSRNGPVEVTSNGSVMASQRALWNGYFNEVMGTVLN